MPLHTYLLESEAVAAHRLLLLLLPPSGSQFFDIFSEHILQYLDIHLHGVVKKGVTERDSGLGIGSGVFLCAVY